MSEEFKIEIIDPEKSFYVNESIIEAVVPAYEGEMGILKDHISIISFLKPGIIKVKTNTGEENFYVEDGILEFKNNSLSILTSIIMDLKNIDKSLVSENLKKAENDLENTELNDQTKFLISQKVEILKSIN